MLIPQRPYTEEDTQQLNTYILHCTQALEISYHTFFVDLLVHKSYARILYRWMLRFYQKNYPHDHAIALLKRGIRLYRIKFK